VALDSIGILLDLTLIHANGGVMESKEHQGQLVIIGGAEEKEGDCKIGGASD